MPPDPPGRRASFAHYKCLPTTPPRFNLPLNKWPDQLLIACATSNTPWETAQLSKFDFTFHAPQQLKIFTRSPYITIKLQNIPKQSKKAQNLFIFNSSWVELLVSCWYIEIMEAPTATTTTTKRFGPSFIIILNKIRVTGVTSEVLERILAPLTESLGMPMYENFDPPHPDSEKSQILPD